MKSPLFAFILISIFQALAHGQYLQRSLKQYDQATGTTQGQRLRSATNSLDAILDILSPIGSRENSPAIQLFPKDASPDQIAELIRRFWQTADAHEEQALRRMLVDISLSNERVLGLFERYSVDRGVFHPQIALRSQQVVEAVNRLPLSGTSYCKWIFNK